MASKETPQPREQWAKQSDAHRTDFDRPEKPLKYQLGAWGLWIVAIAVAWAATLCASGALAVPVLSDLPAVPVVVAVVVDLVAVLAAQRLWRKAASLAGARKQGVVGVVMACIAFAPMCLFFLAAKNAPGRTKVAAVIGAVVSIAAIVALCLVFGGPEAVPEA